MNIYSVLKEDHRKVQALFKELMNQIEEENAAESEDLFFNIKENLIAHNKAEEKTFYSRLQKSKESRTAAVQRNTEHDIAGELLKTLSTLDATSEEFAAKAKVLRELVEHHIKEEEGEVHKLAKKELSDEEAEEIAQQFLDLKEQLLHKNGMLKKDRKIANVQSRSHENAVH